MFLALGMASISERDKTAGCATLSTSTVATLDSTVTDSPTEPTFISAPTGTVTLAGISICCLTVAKLHRESNRVLPGPNVDNGIVSIQGSGGGSRSFDKRFAGRLDSHAHHNGAACIPGYSGDGALRC